MINKKFRTYILVGLALLLICVISFSSYSLAKYQFNAQYNCKLKILTDKLGVYSDAAGTIPLNTTTVWDFGYLRSGEHSGFIDFYCANKSDGQSYIKPQISISALPVGINIFETVYGRVPVQPNWLNLYIPESLTYTPTGLTGQVGYANVESNAMQMWISINNMDSSGYIKIDNEIIHYASIDTSDRWTLKGLERGLCGTTATMHERASTVTWISTPSYTALDCLELNEVQKVELMVNTTNEAESGDITFDVLIQADSEH